MLLGTGLVLGMNDDYALHVDDTGPFTFQTEVTIDSSSSQLEVHATEMVVVNVEIKNIGDESGTAGIELIIDDEFQATQQLSVAGLSTESVAFK